MKTLRPILTTLALCLPAAAQADFIETEWTVTAFAGEAWFIDPQAVIGQTQSFEGGFAGGVFHDCQGAGQSMTYTAYATSDFMANPEFALFAELDDPRLTGAQKVFVHRITCEGAGDPALRRVLYPFVTTDGRDAAFYLFEGGIFTLEPAQ